MALRRKMEWSDLLMLLAQIAEGLGANTSGYDIPADRLEEWLEEAAETGPSRDPGRRHLEVLAAAEAVGGEVS
jgi:hypothetical protein